MDVLPRGSVTISGVRANHTSGQARFYHGFLCWIDRSWRAVQSFPGVQYDRMDDYDYPNVMSYRSHNVLSFQSQNVRFHVISIPEHPISCHTRQVLRSAALSVRSKLSSQSLSKLKTISLHQFIFQLLHNNLTFDILVCPETYV